MSTSLPLQMILMLLLLFYFKGANGSSTVAGESKIRCLEVERQALLNITEALHEIQEGFLSSWGNEEEKRDCCEWYGVQCANNSDHVTVLDLAPSTSPIYDEYYNLRRYLRGNISPSLRELKHLTFLDVSLIDFIGHGIPSFIGTLTKLRYLNLSNSLINGQIPPQLGNLSSLEVLDLGDNNDLRMKSMGWVSHLSSLRLLDLSWTNMSQATDWLQVVTKLPRLTNLHLSGCNLPNVTSSSLSLVNSSTSLAILDLSGNRLSVSIYQWVFSFSRSLVLLDLSYNALEGSIPKAFGNMTSLVYLELSSNEFEGPIPEALGNLTKLTDLNLEGNHLEGSIPEALGNLTELTVLNLVENHLEGSIPEALGNLTKLTHLYLGYNNLEGELPNSLGNLCMLRELRAQGNNLSGLLPFELTQSFPRCTYYSLEFLYLGFNRFRGSLPNLTIFPSLKEVFLAGNQLNGTVPETIGQLAQLEYLSLDGNSLEGVITEAHFSKLTKLSSLYLSDNSLTLKFNDHWVPPFQLRTISLRSCKLGPQFPRWLRTQNKFSELDISNSGISDSIPDWLWDISPECWMMDLSKNQINGKIKSSSLEFQGLSTIDLSSNKL